MEAELARLMCFQWAAQFGLNICRLLDADKQSDLALVIDIKYARSDPKYVSFRKLNDAIASGHAVKVTDPYLYLMKPDVAFDSGLIKRRDQKWNNVKLYLLHPGIFSEQVRRQIIVAAQQKRNAFSKNSLERDVIPSENSLYEAFRRYFQRGMTPNAFIPDYGNIKPSKLNKTRVMGKAPLGRPRIFGLNRAPAPLLSDKEKEAMRKHYKDNYANKDELGNTLSLRQTYKKFLRDLYRVTEEVDGGISKNIKTHYPTWEQWRYECHRKRDRQKVLRGRTDSADFSNNHKPALDNSTAMSQGPWYLLQMDSTSIHVRLVSSIDHVTPVGMAVIFIIVDVFSRVIVGFSLGLKAASWESASAAIYCMMTSKEKLFKKHQIHATDQDIPSGVGERILADRGEMEGYQASTHLSAIGTDIDTTSPKSAAMKGIIEVLHKMILKETNRLPGASKGPRKRGSIDPDRMAVLTVDDLFKIVLDQIVKYNQKHPLSKNYPFSQEMVQAKVRYPLDAFKFGIANQTGLPRVLQQEPAYRCLLPTKLVSRTQTCIPINQVPFICRQKIKESWFLRGEGNERKTIPLVAITYDPVYVKAYLVTPEETIPLEIHPNYVDRFDGATWDDVEAYWTNWKTTSSEAEIDELEADAASSDFIAEVIVAARHAQENKRAVKEQANTQSKKMPAPSNSSYQVAKRDARKAEIKATDPGIRQGAPRPLKPSGLTEPPIKLNEKPSFRYTGPKNDAGDLLNDLEEQIRKSN